MIGIGTLWLAILASAGLLWIVSAMVWMVLPHHKTDYQSLPDEAAARDVLGAQNLAPGQYSIPHCMSMADMQQPETVDKFNKGPVAFITVAQNGMLPMGKNMLLSFVYFLVVSVLIAYVASRTLTPGTDYLTVFRLAGTVAFMAYGLSAIQEGIWFSRPWSAIFKGMFDALLYGLVTAGVFGWLWPAAA